MYNAMLENLNLRCLFLSTALWSKLSHSSSSSWQLEMIIVCTNNAKYMLVSSSIISRKHMHWSKIIFWAMKRWSLSFWILDLCDFIWPLARVKYAISVCISLPKVYDRENRKQNSENRIFRPWKVLCWKLYKKEQTLPFL